jgi:hypothetical protein
LCISRRSMSTGFCICCSTCFCQFEISRQILCGHAHKQKKGVFLDPRAGDRNLKVKLWKSGKDRKRAQCIKTVWSWLH